MMAKGNGAFYLFAWKHECIMHNQCFFPWDRKPGNSPLYHLTKLENQQTTHFTISLNPLTIVFGLKYELIHIK